MAKKFKCDDCGEEFNHIFEYFEIHETVPDIAINLGNGIELNIMQMLEDLFYLNEDGYKEEVATVVSSIACALFASAKGYLPEIMRELEEQDEEQINEIVKKEVKDLDKQIQKLLRSRENGGY